MKRTDGGIWGLGLITRKFALWRNLLSKFSRVNAAPPPQKVRTPFYLAHRPVDLDRQTA